MAAAKKPRAQSAPKKTSAKKSPAKRTTAKSKKAPRRNRATGPANAVKDAPKTKPVESAPIEPQQPERYAVRNRTHYNFSLRLDSQAETKRRTELKPRGQRGDGAPVKTEDLEDPGLLAAVERGILEVITQTELAKIVKKQTVNQQQVHPAMALLRNEYGEEYDEGAVSVAQTFEDQGVVVAELYDGQIAVDRTGIVRPGNEPIPERGNQRLRRPGARPGGSPYVSQSGPQRSSNAEAAKVDAKARVKGLGGPKAGLPDGIQVTVAPTERN